MTNTTTTFAVQIEGTKATVQGFEVVKNDLGRFVGIESKNVAGIQVDFEAKTVAVAVRSIGKISYEGRNFDESAELIAFLTTNADVAKLVTPATVETTVAEGNTKLDENQNLGGTTMTTTNQTIGANQNQTTTTKGDKTMTTTTTTQAGIKLTVPTLTVKANEKLLKNMGVVRTVEVKGKEKGKSVRAMSRQMSLAGATFFRVADNKGSLIRVPMAQVLNYKAAFTNAKGEQEIGLRKDIIIVGTEGNSIEKMAIEPNSSYIVMNEAAQSRTISQHNVKEFEVFNTMAELTTTKVYDARNVLTIDFNGLDGEQMKELKTVLINHIFRFGVWVRHELATQDITAVSSLKELMQYKPLLDTPSQKRQAKVTFFADKKDFTRIDALRAAGNHMVAYAKTNKDGLTPFVKEVEGKKYNVLNVQKNATRFGLLGSSSTELVEFKSKFGKIKSVEVTEQGNVITTTTGLRVLLCDDVFGVTKQAAKVFNTEIKNNKPSDADAQPSLMTAEDFEWNVNTTDGMILSDAKVFAKMLKKQGLGGCRRNGKLRGYTHQFRMNLQVKGLNAVMPKVKEITGFDIILFDGARKTNMVAAMEQGIQLDYHVMQSAATFMNDAMASVSAQIMNNLDLPYELSIAIARKSFADAAEKLRTEVIDAEVNEVEIEEEMEQEEVTAAFRSREFGYKKFVGVNELVLKDAYAKDEIEMAVKEMMKQHQGGRLFVQGKNNYMVSDLFATLLAVADGSFTVTTETAVLNEGEVAIAMMDKETKARYFHVGAISSNRSPEVSADEVQKAQSVDVSAVQWYKEALEGGFLDGLTIFSSLDLMVPASSGADFDGDTSLIIVQDNVVEAIKTTPQYVNFHTKENVEYVVENGVIQGAMVDGELVKNSDILGEGCPWTNPAEAPAFNLPEGFIQQGFDLLVPVEKLDTDEAYTAWMDAAHQVIQMSIMPSDIGSMSNITMALTNAVNFVRMELANAEGDIALELGAELTYLEKMLDVFTAIVWWSIDAAKHGGEYKTILNAWMQWTNKKGMEKELASDEVNCKRLIGYLPSVVDAQGNVLDAKVGILLPAALRESKDKFTSEKAMSMTTNLHVYTELVKEEIQAVEDGRELIRVNSNNLLSEVQPLLEGTDFPVKEAQELYASAVKNLNDILRPMNEKQNQIRNVVTASLDDQGINHKGMNTAKLNDMVKKSNPEYIQLSVNKNITRSQIRHQLRMAVINRGWDVAQFAAAVYVSEYMKAMENEKANVGGAEGATKQQRARAQKAPITQLWTLLEEELMVMLTAIKGAKIKVGKTTEMNTELHNITDLYFDVAEGFEPKNPIYANRNFFITKNQVWVANEQNNAPELLAGTLTGYTGYKFVPAYTYLASVSLLNVTTKGVKYAVDRLFVRPVEYVDAKAVQTEEVYEAPAQETQAQAVAAIPVETQYNAINFPQQGQFVAIRSKGKMYFGIQQANGVQTLAVSKADVTTAQEGVMYNVDIQLVVDGVNGAGIVIKSATLAKKN